MGRVKWKPYSGLKYLHTSEILLSSFTFSVGTVSCLAVIEEVIERILCILKLVLLFYHEIMK